MPLITSVFAAPTPRYVTDITNDDNDDELFILLKCHHAMALPPNSRSQRRSVGYRRP